MKLICAQVALKSLIYVHLPEYNVRIEKLTITNINYDLIL